MKNEHFENEYIKFWIEDGILFGEYEQNLNIDLHSAKQIVKDRITFCRGKDYPHVLLITGIKNTSKEARDYFSTEGIANMKSMALLTNSPISRTIGNFFLFFNKPKVPTKLFTSRDEAIEWSKGF